jgi:hypothetical protein
VKAAIAEHDDDGDAPAIGARVFLATNSRDEAELAQLQTLLPGLRRYKPTLSAAPTSPAELGVDVSAAEGGAGGERTVPAEWVPMIEQLLCARANLFIGNAASTFSSTVVSERDRHGWPRSTLRFFGIDRREMAGAGNAEGGSHGAMAGAGGAVHAGGAVSCRIEWN